VVLILEFQFKIYSFLKKTHRYNLDKIKKATQKRIAFNRYKVQLLFLSRAGIESYNRIQRAKTHKAGQKENDCNYDEHNAQSTGYDSAKIEICCNQSNDGTDNPIRGSHVRFHFFVCLGVE
jgi:hypothetical protein